MNEREDIKSIINIRGFERKRNRCIEIFMSMTKMKQGIY